MIIEAATRAFFQVFSAPFRIVFLKTLGLTLAILVALWFALAQAFEWMALPWLQQWTPSLPDWTGWLGMVAAIAAGIGLALALALLIAPVTTLVAGLFLDETAEVVERRDYPGDPPGHEMPTIAGFILSMKFFGIVVVGNLLALFLLLVPGINIAAFFLVNGYLLGREFFEFAAMRLRGEADAKALRKRHAGTVFAGGMVIAAFMSVPLLNLVTPLFACAMMVHLHKAVAARESQVRGGAVRRVP